MPMRIVRSAVRTVRTALALLLVGPSVMASQAMSPDVRQFVRVDAPVVALTHVRIIDGTGAPARDDQTIVITRGMIEETGPASMSTPIGAQVLDLHGYSVIPGLVGMHDHMFYTSSVDRDSTGRTPPPGQLLGEEAFSFPRLYLAAGVTTIRTTGSVEPYADLSLKMQIDDGRAPGPTMYISSPYLEGKGTQFPQMHELTGPDDARKMVDFWADAGVTSFKAYMHITQAELGAAIGEAHQRGIKVTGHLCSVGWREAMAVGIDDFEHGPIYTDAEFVPSKQADICPAGAAMAASWINVDVPGPRTDSLIHDLVAHHVAVTSTLPVFELSVPGRPPLEARVMNAMSLGSRASYLTMRARVVVPTNGQPAPSASLFAKEEAFELAFAKAGGLLLAGLDPTGSGGVLAGFGDQREVELLVEAGFSPVEAIRIATANGAEFLGQLEHFGTVVPGKRADLVVIKGDPSTRINDIENVELVFKGGVGYDSQKLIAAVRGVVGIR